jgi:alpha-ketoglutarate-dependent sulfate ester dioxygenase
MSAVAESGLQQGGGVTVRPLQPTIGAQIAGVDLRYPLSDAARDQVRAAILDYKVVFFRDQELDRDQFAAFARQFGPLYIHPCVTKPDPDEAPAIHLISAAAARSHQKTAEPERETWDPYHTDTSWRLVPAWASVLRAVTLPEVGGDTIWVDAGLAYDALPEETKKRLDGLHVTHDFRPELVRSGLDYPIVAHPIVRTHRETGRKILWVNFSARPWIVGLDRDQGGELLSIVHDQYRRPEYQVRFRWRPGSVAFWDNRAAMHCPVRDYGDFPRLLERILIADEPQYADL